MAWNEIILLGMIPFQVMESFNSKTMDGLSATYSLRISNDATRKRSPDLSKIDLFLRDLGLA
jgi:hypothetical protein